MPPALKYKFDQCEADVNAAELLGGGTRLRLQMKPFQVLVALLERPREVITREELRLRLWPEDTFVDFDHGLNPAVVKLRDVLGDSAGNPRYVETIAKRGYRFLGNVQIIQEPGTAQAPAGAVASPGSAAPDNTQPTAPAGIGAHSPAETGIPPPSRSPPPSLLVL